MALSVGGFPVGVAVSRACEYPRRRADQRFRALQDGVLAGRGPGWERRAEVVVVGVFVRDREALPVGELFGEGLVPDPIPGSPLHPRRDGAGA
jgi:hypothetical protein